MNYKILIILFLFVFSSCTTVTENLKTKEIISKTGFKNNGFTLVYDDKLYKNKTISSKLDNRSLIIFQRNLKKGSVVKIKNNKNNKCIN